MAPIHVSEEEFYDGIEEPIRPIVKTLIDNGIATQSSCGHEMTILLKGTNKIYSNLGLYMNVVSETLRRNGYRVFHMGTGLTSFKKGALMMWPIEIYFPKYYAPRGSIQRLKKIKRLGISVCVLPPMKNQIIFTDKGHMILDRMMK